jgi:hypothetical protein
MSEIDNIISEMTPCDKRIMVIIGGINASPNKNFERQTVKKKASDEEMPHVDDAIKKFQQWGLLTIYRAPDNLAATKLGFNVAQRLVEERLKERYKGIRIIRR